MNYIENVNIFVEEKFYNNVYINKIEKLIMFFNSVAFSEKIIYEFSDLKLKKKDFRNNFKNFIFFLKSEKKNLILKFKGNFQEIENSKKKFIDNGFFLENENFNENNFLNLKKKLICEKSLKKKENFDFEKNFISKKKNFGKKNYKLDDIKKNLVNSELQNEKIVKNSNLLEKKINLQNEKILNLFLEKKSKNSKKSIFEKKDEIFEKRKGFYSGSNFLNSGISSVEFNSKKKGNLILREQSPVKLRPKIIKEEKEKILENSKKILEIENFSKIEKNSKKEKISKKENLFKKFFFYFKKKKKIKKKKKKKKVIF